MSEQYFHVRGRVIFGDVLLFIPNLAQFSFVRKKTERQTDKQFKLNCYKRKRKRKRKKKENEKGKVKEKEKEREKEKDKEKETRNKKRETRTKE